MKTELKRNELELLSGAVLLVHTNKAWWLSGDVIQMGGGQLK